MDSKQENEAIRTSQLHQQPHLLHLQEHQQKQQHQEQGKYQQTQQQQEGLPKSKRPEQPTNSQPLTSKQPPQQQQQKTSTKQLTLVEREYWQQRLPHGFQFYLERLARGVIRNQPENILEFSAVYLEELLVSRNELWKLPIEPYFMKLFHKKTGHAPWQPRRRHISPERENLFAGCAQTLPDVVATEYLPESSMSPGEICCTKTSEQEDVGLFKNEEGILDSPDMLTASDCLHKEQEVDVLKNRSLHEAAHDNAAPYDISDATSGGSNTSFDVTEDAHGTFTNDNGREMVTVVASKNFCVDNLKEDHIILSDSVAGQEGFADKPINIEEAGNTSMLNELISAKVLPENGQEKHQPIKTKFDNADTNLCDKNNVLEVNEGMKECHEMKKFGRELTRDDLEEKEKNYGIMERRKSSCLLPSQLNSGVENWRLAGQRTSDNMLSEIKQMQDLINQSSYQEPVISECVMDSVYSLEPSLNPQVSCEFEKSDNKCDKNEQPSISENKTFVESTEDNGARDMFIHMQENGSNAGHQAMCLEGDVLNGNFPSPDEDEARGSTLISLPQASVFVSDVPDIPSTELNSMGDQYLENQAGSSFDPLNCEDLEKEDKRMPQILPCSSGHSYESNQQYLATVNQLIKQEGGTEDKVETENTVTAHEFSLAKDKHIDSSVDKAIFKHECHNAGSDVLDIGFTAEMINLDFVSRDNDKEVVPSLVQRKLDSDERVAEALVEKIATGPADFLSTSTKVLSTEAVLAYDNSGYSETSSDDEDSDTCGLISEIQNEERSMKVYPSCSLQKNNEVEPHAVRTRPQNKKSSTKEESPELVETSMQELGDASAQGVTEVQARFDMHVLQMDQTINVSGQTFSSDINDQDGQHENEIESRKYAHPAVFGEKDDLSRIGMELVPNSQDVFERSLHTSLQFINNVTGDDKDLHVPVKEGNNLIMHAANCEQHHETEKLLDRESVYIRYQTEANTEFSIRKKDTFEPEQEVLQIGEENLDTSEVSGEQCDSGEIGRIRMDSISQCSEPQNVDQTYSIENVPECEIMDAVSCLQNASVDVHLSPDEHKEICNHVEGPGKIKMERALSLAKNYIAELEKVALGIEQILESRSFSNQISQKLIDLCDGKDDPGNLEDESLKGSFEYRMGNVVFKIKAVQCTSPDSRSLEIRSDCKDVTSLNESIAGEASVKLLSSGRDIHSSDRGEDFIYENVEKMVAPVVDTESVNNNNTVKHHINNQTNPSNSINSTNSQNDAFRVNIQNDNLRTNSQSNASNSYNHNNISSTNSQSNTFRTSKRNDIYRTINMNNNNVIADVNNNCYYAHSRAYSDICAGWVNRKLYSAETRDTLCENKTKLVSMPSFSAIPLNTNNVSENTNNNGNVGSSEPRNFAISAESSSGTISKSEDSVKPGKRQTELSHYSKVGRSDLLVIDGNKVYSLSRKATLSEGMADPFIVSDMDGAQEETPASPETYKKSLNRSQISKKGETVPSPCTKNSNEGSIKQKMKPRINQTGPSKSVNVKTRPYVIGVKSLEPKNEKSALTAQNAGTCRLCDSLYKCKTSQSDKPEDVDQHVADTADVSSDNKRKQSPICYVHNRRRERLEQLKKEMKDGKSKSHKNLVCLKKRACLKKQNTQDCPVLYKDNQEELQDNMSDNSSFPKDYEGNPVLIGGHRFAKQKIEYSKKNDFPMRVRKTSKNEDTDMEYLPTITRRLTVESPAENFLVHTSFIRPNPKQPEAVHNFEVTSQKRRLYLGEEDEFINTEGTKRLICEPECFSTKDPKTKHLVVENGTSNVMHATVKVVSRSVKKTKQRNASLNPSRQISKEKRVTKALSDIAKDKSFLWYENRDLQMVGNYIIIGKPTETGSVQKLLQDQEVKAIAADNSTNRSTNALQLKQIGDGSCLSAQYKVPFPGYITYNGRGDHCTLEKTDINMNNNKKSDLVLYNCDGSYCGGVLSSKKNNSLVHNYMNHLRASVLNEVSFANSIAPSLGCLNIGDTIGFIVSSYDIRMMNQKSFFLMNCFDLELVAYSSVVKNPSNTSNDSFQLCKPFFSGNSQSSVAMFELNTNNNSAYGGKKVPELNKHIPRELEQTSDLKEKKFKLKSEQMKYEDSISMLSSLQVCTSHDPSGGLQAGRNSQQTQVDVRDLSLTSEAQTGELLNYLSRELPKRYPKDIDTGHSILFHSEPCRCSPQEISTFPSADKGTQVSTADICPSDEVQTGFPREVIGHIVPDYMNIQCEHRQKEKKSKRSCDFGMQVSANDISLSSMVQTGFSLDKNARFLEASKKGQKFDVEVSGHIRKSLSSCELSPCGSSSGALRREAQTQVVSTDIQPTVISQTGEPKTLSEKLPQLKKCEEAEEISEVRWGSLSISEMTPVHRSAYAHTQKYVDMTPPVSGERVVHTKHQPGASLQQELYYKTGEDEC